MIEIFKKQRVLLYTLLINCCGFILLMLIFSPQFQAKQDVIMQTLVYGVGGETTSRLVFSNIIIGKMLTLFSSIMAAPWYIIFQYMVVFISLNTIIFITLKRYDRVLGMLISVILMIFIGYDCYILPQYMKTSALLIVTAAYVLFYTIKSQKRKRWDFLVLFLAILGSLISFDTYFIIGILCLCEIFIFFLIEKNVHMLNKKIVLLILCIILPLCFKAYDTYFYQTHSDSKEGLKYRNSLIKIYDLGMPDYTETTKINEDTYNLIKNGIIMDYSKITPSVLSGLIQSNRKLNINTIYKFFRTMPIKSFKIGMFYCLLALSALLLLTKTRNKKYIFLSMVGCGIVFFFTLFLCNSLGYEWVGTIGFLALSLFLLMAKAEVHLFEIRYLCAYLSVLGLILYNNFNSQFNTHSASSDTIEYWMGEIKENSQNAYIIDLDSLLKNCSVFWNYPKAMAQADNIFYLNTEYASGCNGYKWNGAADVQKKEYEEVYLILPNSINIDTVMHNVKSVLPNVNSADSEDVINDNQLYKLQFN